MSQLRVDDLITGGIDLAQRIAGAYPLPQGADRPNVEGAALLGLTKAALDFDPARGIPFDAYAARRIRGEIIDALRAEDHLTRTTRRRLSEDGAPRLKVSDRRPSSLNLIVRTSGPPMSDDAERLDFVPDENAERAFRFVEMRLTLLDCLGKLSERQLAVVALRYFGGFTMSEIGRIFSVSEARISQINARAAEEMAREQRYKPRAIAVTKAAVHSTGASDAGLTVREAQIVGLVSEGMSNPEIATELWIGIETVKTHMRNIAEKWGTHGRAHVVGEAYRRGILETAA